jgi:BirA family transcriptional regulator, biotin operon repressor / biotin---[acetyl-CoA-carboxylase] ligase
VSVEDTQGATLHWLASVASTQHEAKQRLMASQVEGLPWGVMVATTQQTQGRGAGFGRRWYSQPGQALCLSWAVRPTVAIQAPQWAWLPHLAGWVVAEALQARWPGLPIALKPLNDVWLSTPRTAGKVGGILVERGGSLVGTSLPTWVIIGLGLNLLPLHPDVASALPYCAAALSDALATPPTQAQLTSLVATLGDAQHGWPALLNQVLPCPQRSQAALAAWRGWLRHGARP